MGYKEFDYARKGNRSAAWVSYFEGSLTIFFIFQWFVEVDLQLISYGYY